MAQELEFTLKRLNGTDFDTLYPSTTWAQVKNKPLTYTPTAHTHGDISDTGTITSTAVTPGTSDYILIADSSASGTIKRGIAITTGGTNYLKQDGTWANPDTDLSKAVGTDINAATATLGSSHRNKFIRVIYTSGAVTLTIDTAANAGFSIGDEIHILRYTSQEVTIARATGVSLYSEGSATENAGKKRINARMQVVTMKCIAANVWVLFGALKA